MGGGSGGGGADSGNDAGLDGGVDAGTDAGTDGGTGLCATVQCSAMNVCDPTDGLCKCKGVVCLAGERCDPALGCVQSSACNQVTCSGLTTCDPADGLCKCGGAGGPVCASNQICVLTPQPVCQGGGACNQPDGGPVTCAGNTSCDPNDGVCKCGGAGGIVCSTGEICVNGFTSNACRTPCDPLSPSCTAGNFCFFDYSVAIPVAYCAAPTGSSLEGDACTTATQCFASATSRSLVCVGLFPGQAGICREYCDATNDAGCPQTPPNQMCMPLPGATDAGFCQPP
jgi:hypothetical protein